MRVYGVVGWKNAGKTGLMERLVIEISGRGFSVSTVKHTPFGFGLGISFETKAGIFSLNYALGYQENELAPLRAAKIHFGFVNFF